MSTSRDDSAADAPPLDPAVTAGPTPPAEPPAPAVSRRPRPTRISGTWVAVVVAIVVLAFLLVFILQNLTDVTIHFLGGAFTWPLGVSLLFAALAGALLVALVGAARILQLRRQAKRASH
ncbi:lipopolysaccharide assembly protein LapA domain-containing protein [Allokutzneria oryzae]|uniref:Lipopolysaccharide assembly protein LapA domain-containing protein n=1 Tax=Allokutzneria oryzae TaxID=1378989 RepID=A0ABV5ZQM5_9PSEU